MRFYAAEEWMSDLLARVPWRWLLLPLLAVCAVARGAEWLVWHGY